MCLHLTLQLSDFNNEKCVISILCIFNYCYILPTLGCCNKARLSDLHLVVVVGWGWGGGRVSLNDCLW